MIVKIKNIHSILVALSLAGHALFAGVSNAFNIPTFYGSYTLRLIIFIFSVAIIIRCTPGRGGIRILYISFFSTFWALYLIRVYIETSDPSNTLSQTAIYYWSWALGGCLIPSFGALAYARINNEGTVRLCWGLLMSSAALILMFGENGMVNADGGVVDIGRLNIDGLNPISVGNIGASLLLISLWVVYFEKKFKLKISILYYFSTLVGGYLILFSLSRGPLVSCLFALLVFLLIKSNKLRRKHIIGSALVIAVLISFAVNLSDEFISNFWRFSSVDTEADLSYMARRQAYLGSLGQFMSNPLFGDALEERTISFYPHNVIIESLLATGIVGGVAFLLLLIMGFRCAVNILNGDSNSGWVGLLYFQYFMSAQFSGAIYTITTFWILSSLVIMASMQRKNTTQLFKVNRSAIAPS